MGALRDLVICVKSGGDIASGVIWRLRQANFRKIFILEVAKPLAVRRAVSFCEAVHDGSMEVEGVRSVLVKSPAEFESVWASGDIPMMVDPEWRCIGEVRPDVVVDGILAKRNLGTNRDEAPLTIGLGPGFTAGDDVHLVVETKRGHNLGRVITEGPAAPNTGTPGVIGGYALERVLRAPCAGALSWNCELGDLVEKDQVLGHVDDVPVIAEISGVLRGQIRPDVDVVEGLKIGDVDPRGDVSYVPTISDKGRAV